MTDFRRHVATRVIVVPVPYEVGTVKETHRVKPPAYRHGQREAWRPATRPPNKAERIARWLDQMKRQEEIVREFMKPDATLLKAWLTEGRFVEALASSAIKRRLIVRMAFRSLPSHPSPK